MNEIYQYERYPSHEPANIQSYSLTPIICVPWNNYASILYNVGNSSASGAHE